MLFQIVLPGPLLVGAFTALHRASIPISAAEAWLSTVDALAMSLHIVSRCEAILLGTACFAASERLGMLKRMLSRGALV